MILIEANFLSSFSRRLVSITAVLACCMIPCLSFAASDNGCDNLNANDSINPEIALCSTHVYNIKEVNNFESGSSRNQLMKDVVALKSTVIMQQMYKQYEYLDATLNRLKSQLEREVTTAKFEVAGASSSSGSSSSSSMSSDRNVVLIGAENCLLKTNTTDGLNCIQSNIRIILQAVSSGNIGEAYRQLQKDLSFAEAYGVSSVKSENGKFTSPSKCVDLKPQRDPVNNCAYALNIAVMQKVEDLNKSRQQNNQQFRY